MKKSRFFLINSIILAVFIIMMTACSSEAADKLYALPQGAEEYVALEREINVLLSKGAEYSPPTSGSYRQSVQLEDLDGDGLNEAIVFLAVSGDARPLKIYIFKEEDGKFVQTALLEGEGTNFDSVNYIDANFDGSIEMIVGRQVSSSVKMLTVYSTKKYEMSVLVSTDYLEYTICNISEYDGADLFIIKDSEGADQTKEASVLSFDENKNISETKARLTKGAESISRLRTTNLSDGSRAVLVEGRMSGGAIFTDIFTIIDDKAENITLNTASGISEDTLRTFEAYCRDINNDGVIEIPIPILISGQGENGEHLLYKWYAYDSRGRREQITTTYSNTADGWRLTIPSSWEGEITVRRAEYISGERSVVFSLIKDNGEIEDALIISTLSGENKAERSRFGGRFVLAAENEQIFAAKILATSAADALGITASMVRENFSVIYPEWNPGEI